MDAALPGMLAIVGAGVMLLALASFLDWRSQRIAENALHDEAPESLSDLPAPEYITADDLDARAAGASPDDELTTAELEGLAQTVMAAPLADPRFLAEGHAPAVLRGPLVLVCADEVASAREVLPVLQRAAEQHSPLVVAAPALAHDLVELLLVNRRRGLLDALALTTDAAACEALARVSGAHPVPRADLQSGWVPDSALGRVVLLRAGADDTTVWTDGTPLPR